MHTQVDVTHNDSQKRVVYLSFIQWLITAIEILGVKQIELRKHTN